MSISETIGIVGGSGMLGGAIARGLLHSGTVAPERLWLSNRSGLAPGFDDWPAIHITTSSQELVDACELVLLSVPPQAAPALEIDAAGRLVVSLMASVTVAEIASRLRSDRVVRAMSSPAAEIGLAYSPWCASAAVTEADRRTVGRIFQGCGLTDEVSSEEQIDRFTALTGPVPGFVALYADCMVQHAIRHGIDSTIAERAIRQLFRASGVVLASSKATPAQHVREMIDYAGTTAAGLEVMQASHLGASIEAGLEAAFRKARGLDLPSPDR